jgi:hypothetical protein
MKTLFRFRTRTIVVAALATVAALSSVGLGWREEFDLGFVGPGSSIGETRLEQQRLDSMNQECERTSRRVSMRESIVENLLSGLLTLREAAEQFDALNHTNPPTLAFIRSRFEGNSDEERAARQVIAFVGEYLMQRPSEREKALQRLEYEYRREYGRD